MNVWGQVQGHKMRGGLLQQSLPHRTETSVTPKKQPPLGMSFLSEGCGLL